jgi:aminopeptidase N
MSSPDTEPLRDGPRAARRAVVRRAARAAAAMATGLLAALPLAPPLASQAPRDTLHPYRPGVDVLHYELSLSLPDSGSEISARAGLAVRRTAPIDTLVLDLAALRVESVTVNDAAARFARDSATIRIPLPAGGRDTLRVAVRYRGRVTDGLIARHDSASGAWTYFGDNWPNRARHWIPSVDHPSDKATVAWTVEHPASLRVVANGALVMEAPLPRRGRTGAPRALTRWVTTRPIPVYLMVIGAAPLAFHNLGDTACGLADIGGCVEQSVYTLPSASHQGDSVRVPVPPAFRKAGAIVELFARLVAPFPYEKLAHIQSATRFGGMENASAIFYSDQAFRRGTLDEGLVAHETAHQWFGDAVTEREWGHLWLSEGFATYFAQLWTEHSRGDSAFRAGMAEIRDQIALGEATASRPVLDTAEADYLKLLNTNSYQKGAWVLHMLRAQVGDSAFFRSVRAYYAAHRHGTALTDDLRRAVEREAGAELGWFFDQWLRRPGMVEGEVRWRFDRRARRVVLEVEQGSRFAPYRFPLVVELRDAGGAARRATVTVAASRSQRITVPLELDRAPASVVVDPDVLVLGGLRVRRGD